MESKFDKLSNDQSLGIFEQDKLYAKFRALGANVDRLRELGLAMPKLELLLECLQPMHDKKLVRFITSIGRSRPESYSTCNGRRTDTYSIQKMCPRCTRELTNANVIKQDSYDGEFINIVVVCECGYIREIRNPTSGPLSQRQSTLQEYARI